MTTTPLDPKTLTVLVTGATSGFGEAIARRFIGAGAKVVGTGRRVERLEKLKSELGDAFHFAEHDVRDYEATVKLFESLPEPFAGVNVVAANAGLALGLLPGDQVAIDDWHTMIDTNVTGFVNTVRAALPGMVARGQGHVFGLGSVAGDYPYPGGNTYGGTKAFVKQFCLALRADMLGKNIRVTNIEPGMVETEFSLVRFKGAEDKASSVYENMRGMTADDVAETIFWCATLPAHVNINRLQVMPTDQAFSPFAVHRGKAG
ncbi:SDR family NAD(P)-dependent oxidoreductase [Chenggangzhangella methanolivorans]|uniref:SDR family NAD(P)-dependent oxidoreductase n=1 Tax=Chenggangzhangella methanolivorans TaxID=1437009 RepID=A0A9E6RCJ7_9HYPH|nr:SDR family NAD(P)-dependent oxidoreductase [Chenggangzhangella methanolivorans]QZO00804.1 SDR family NAD(P)-dependent oxidoreductase [Chenggangzhangella methanolivorans]